MNKITTLLAILVTSVTFGQTVNHKKGDFDVRDVEDYSIVELFGKHIQVDGENVSKLNKKSVLTIDGVEYKKKQIKRALFIKMMIKNGYEVSGTRNETRSFYNPAIKSQQTVSFPVTTFLKKQ